ncbi:hypothetical protein SALBM311S_01017 [Streptomyces alboniger]
MTSGAVVGSAAVRVQGLWKRFGQQVAVAGIDLALPAGKFIGLVGPNGAGKTTTLSMVTGLLRPDQGSVEVVGHDVWRDPVEVKARIGVLPEGLRLFERLSGRELLSYNGRLRGLPAAEVDKRATRGVGCSCHWVRSTAVRRSRWEACDWRHHGRPCSCRRSCWRSAKAEPRGGKE